MSEDDPRTTLLALAAGRGISLSALSGLINRNISYLQQYVHRNSPRRLAENDRHALAQFFGISESLLGGSQDNSYIASGPKRRSDWIDVPRLAQGASAGPGSFTADERPIGTLRFSSRWLRGQGFDPRLLSAIVVAGDSMEPALRDGDEILVDRRPAPLREGVHVVRADETVLVKRLDLGQPGYITLISDNPAYRPVMLAPDAVEVIGRVVWKSGRI